MAKIDSVKVEVYYKPASIFNDCSGYVSTWNLFDTYNWKGFYDSQHLFDQEKRKRLIEDIDILANNLIELQNRPEVSFELLVSLRGKLDAAKAIIEAGEEIADIICEKLERQMEI